MKAINSIFKKIMQEQGINLTPTKIEYMGSDPIGLGCYMYMFIYDNGEDSSPRYTRYAVRERGWDRNSGKFVYSVLKYDDIWLSSTPLFKHYVDSPYPVLREEGIE